MNIPAGLKYTSSHEWLRAEPDGSVTVGITDHAQALLGDIVFIDLPEVGSAVEAQQAVSVIESVKAASDIHAPVAGTVIEVNQVLAEAPEGINEDAYAAWLFKLQPDHPAQMETLLTAEHYQHAIGD